MKKMTVLTAMILLAIIISGCEEGRVVYIDPEPAAPTGLTSITADESIYLSWYPVGEDDVRYYVIYRNTSGPDHLFYEQEIISASYTYWIDYDVTNGVTYYYAVSAIDKEDQESELSDYVFDTPRPEGHSEIIYEVDEYSYYEYTGFDLAGGERVPYNDPDCDFYLDYDTGLNAFFIVLNYSEDYIQDFGYVDDFDDISYAPSQGWSGFNDIEAIPGHMYILRLYHYSEWHYARIWVRSLNEYPDYMIFDWAYQVDPGNRELVINQNLANGNSINSNSE